MGNPLAQYGHRHPPPPFALRVRGPTDVCSGSLGIGSRDQMCTGIALLALGGTMVPMGSSPEEIRLRYLYRSIILRGSVHLPLEAAKKLVGPDCAYHLYSTVKEQSAATPTADSPGREEAS